MAQNKPVRLGPFLGLNNRLKRHALTVPDKGAYLADAVNVDLDATGRLSCSNGQAKVSALSSAHSLFGNQNTMLFASGGSLHRVTDMTTLSHTSIDTVAGSHVSYVEINGEIFYSDGSKIRCLSAANVVRSVGIPVPASLSAGAAGGTLQPAWYQATITYFVGDEEGGAFPSVNIELSSAGGIALFMPATPSGVTAIGVYVSGPNGEVPMLHSIIAPTGMFVITGEPTLRACQTQFKQPMPAGAILATLPGYLFSASGNAVSYSDPYNFAITSPEKNYIPFSSEVSVMIGCENGLYVVADKTYWITGFGTPELNMLPILPYGAVKWSQTKHPTEKKVYWLSRRGLVVADDQGQIANLQEKALLLDLQGAGASLFIEGNNRIVTTNG